MTTQATGLLATVLIEVAARHRDDLQRQKANAADYDRPDFIWHYLLQSFSTMGSSRGYKGVMEDAENYAALSFDALAGLPEADRVKTADAVFRRAKVRQPAAKAKWLIAAFDRVAAMGGPVSASAALRKVEGRDAKIAWLRDFNGIGKKYARNIMMDVYHPEFRDVIAVDARIQSVSDALGLHFKRYEDAERFYIDVARRAELEPWELDRLLYGFTGEVLAGLKTFALAERVVEAVRERGLDVAVVRDVISGS